MKRRKGSILILAMFLLTVVTLLGGLFLTIAVGNIKLQVKDSERQKAFWIAKAGVAELVHNLRGYYNLYEQYNGEQEFGGGKYKIGSATLIGRGYHNTLVVSVGQYPLETTEITSVSKYALVAEVSMNTPTDYLQFSDTGKVQSYYRNTLIGPVHVNGDVIVGRSWGNGAFIKSENEYGPALEASGKIYNGCDWDSDSAEPDNSGCYLLAGEGPIPTSITSPYSNPVIPYSKFAYITPAGFASAGWPGWVPSHGALWPYNARTHGAPFVVTKSRPDGSEYKYNLIDDKDTGGREIRVPKTNEITYAKYKDLIDPDWHITWANPKGTVTNITNEVIYTNPISYGPGYDSVSDGYGIGNGDHREKLPDTVSFSMNGADISIPADRDMNYIKYVCLRLKATPELFRGVVGVAQDSDSSYTIDRAARKIKLSFPMYIDRFKFQLPPGYWGAPSSGYWRGRKQKGLASDNLQTSKITCQGRRIYLPSLYAGVAVDGIVAETGTHGVSVYEKFGENLASEIVWKQAPNNDLSLTSSTLAIYDTSTGTVTETISKWNYFQVDYAQGVVQLGCETNGTMCSNASDTSGSHYIEVIYSHDFKVSDGVEAWIHEKQKVVKLDLGTITEANCPRDPKFKDSVNLTDRKKYGVIFSEVPMVVWGVPKAPVTIVCMSDLYVGPINAPYNDPSNIDNWIAPKNPNPALVQDSPDAKAVGLIVKGMLLYDYTLGTSSSAVFNSTFSAGPTGGSKGIILNKVAIYHSWIHNPDPYDASIVWYKDRFGMIGMGGAYQPVMGSYGGLNPKTGSPTLIGSIYYCADSNLITEAAAKKVSDAYLSSNSVGTVVYANSFRRNPPQHMPMNVFMTNYRILNNYDNAETFLSGLANYLATGAGTVYNAEFSETITKLVDEMEGAN
ncbi:MAG: hypothetical protein A2231_09745 [Candidatus Firestonebacteria bacterium RIFOXYA2_FULL_40_8]|nr:MAG: hypothetical protein A2231_09745 [Candidatus Firestonebacteria bacterium RIFOXYA2_FULL_40_8]